MCIYIYLYIYSIYHFLSLFVSLSVSPFPSRALLHIVCCFHTHGLYHLLVPPHTSTIGPFRRPALKAQNVSLVLDYQDRLAWKWLELNPCDRQSEPSVYKPKFLLG